MINYVNNKVFNLCLDNQKMEFIQHSKFAINHDLNYNFVWKDKIHTSNIGWRQLVIDFNLQARVKHFNILKS